MQKYLPPLNLFLPYVIPFTRCPCREPKRNRPVYMNKNDTAFALSDIGVVQMTNSVAFIKLSISKAYQLPMWN